MEASGSRYLEILRLFLFTSGSSGTLTSSCASASSVSVSQLVSVKYASQFLSLSGAARSKERFLLGGCRQFENGCSTSSPGHTTQRPRSAGPLVLRSQHRMLLQLSFEISTTRTLIWLRLTSALAHGQVAAMSAASLLMGSRHPRPWQDCLDSSQT